MTEEGRSDENEASLRMANEFVEVANNKLATGIHPMVIASAIRHAAANFTAFAYAHGCGSRKPVSLDSIEGFSVIGHPLVHGSLAPLSHFAGHFQLS